MTAYQHLQRIVSAIKRSEAGKAFGAGDRYRPTSDERAGPYVWTAKRTAEWNGADAPAIVWEDGPYEWAYTFTDTDGAKLGPLATDARVTGAVAALRADGFYLECGTSWMLLAYPL